ncbi:MAG: hypothetical protein AAF170_02680 [Bacteroidota bacterium]
MRFLLALLSLITTPVAAQSLVAFPEPTRTDSGAICTRFEAVRVCRQPDGDDGHVVVKRNGRETLRWSASYPGLFDDLRVFRLPDDRLLVAVLDAVSNGISISTRTLTVTDGNTVLYSFMARDFDPDGGSFGVWNRQPVLWATVWRGMDDPSGRRGPGYYLVGRPFFLGPDGLMPVADLPIRVRRLLHSFQRGPGGPVAWLSDRRAESRRHDPFWSGRSSGTPGIITSVDLASSTVTVRVGDRDKEVRLNAWAGGEDRGRFGDAATGRLFPPGYMPTNIEGQLVQIGDGPDGLVVLWIEGINSS